MKTLFEIYNEIGTGVGFADKGTTHNYIQEYYSKAFEPYRDTSNGVLEIGIFHGHSINMWRKYFEQAKIYGIDIVNRNSNCSGCELIYADATLETSYVNIDNLDVIIDDGSHMAEYIFKSFDILFPKLNVGGIYAIEDINGDDFDKGLYNNLHPDMKVYDLRDYYSFDNIIIEIIKK